VGSPVPRWVVARWGVSKEMRLCYVQPLQQFHGIIQTALYANQLSILESDLHGGNKPPVRWA